jgi:hypothetical protein
VREVRDPFFQLAHKGDEVQPYIGVSVFTRMALRLAPWAPSVILCKEFSVFTPRVAIVLIFGLRTRKKSIAVLLGGLAEVNEKINEKSKDPEFALSPSVSYKIYLSTYLYSCW